MKKVYKLIMLVAIAAAIGFTVYNVQSDELQISSLAMENVEALAGGESGAPSACPYDGYMCIVRYSDGTYVTYDGYWP